MNINTKYNRIITYCCIISLVLILSGCVKRKITINTEPQGALVSLNDEEIGYSPVSVDFNWYGDYKVRAMKPGYQILNTHRELEAPLHDGFPFDFLAEILWPGQIQDEYEWTFKLTPYKAPDRDDLVQSANAMKKQALDELKQLEEAQELDLKD